MSLKAKEIMTKEVITVRKDSKVEDVAKILLENRIGGLPVTDEENRVVGIVSETDLLNKEKHLEMPPYITFMESYIFLGSMKKFESDLKKLSATTVDQIMSEEVVVVEEDEEISEIVNLMLESNVNRVPVVDKEGRIQGIICRYDVIKSMFNKERIE